MVSYDRIYECQNMAIEMINGERIEQTLDEEAQRREQQAKWLRTGGGGAVAILSSLWAAAYGETPLFPSCLFPPNCFLSCKCSGLFSWLLSCMFSLHFC